MAPRLRGQRHRSYQHLLMTSDPRAAVNDLYKSGDGWIALLEGEPAGMAHGVVDEIALQLARRAPSREPGFKGDAAAVLLLAQCGRAEAVARLEAALLAAVAKPLTISLFGGLTGMSWVLDYLVGPDAGAALAHFDNALW